MPCSQPPLCTGPAPHWHLHTSFSAQDRTGQPGIRMLSLLLSCLHGQGPHSSASCERRESSTAPSASFFLPTEITEKEETCQKTH